MLLERLIFLKHQLVAQRDKNESDGRITPLHGSILLAKLMDFYEIYVKVVNFLDSLNSCDILSEELNYGNVTVSYGMYLRAFGDGLMDIEKIYLDDLCKLERAILNNEVIPELALSDPLIENSSSYNVISKIMRVYSKLLQMIDTITLNKLHGCQILDLCLKVKYFLPDEIFSVLLKSLHKPFLKQITSWIVFGKLEDPRGEFFVKHAVNSEEPILHAGSLSVTSTHYSRLSGTHSTIEMKEENYVIDNSLLPAHVSFSLAHNIVKTGKLVSLLHQIPDTINKASLQVGDFGFNEDEILKTMKKLEQYDNFNLCKVEKVVNFVWKSVDKIK